ncbi:SanA/YdcF family protein [Aestuariimicrobium sp. T2.26MG-19.2B]|uniref:SanA/YdcF family protein n=1 Tax=Aestuariimicrobium sp. T2.26MG-19.2B TaxID=3040679 RepID=UPI00247744AE|nr:hypothetical protein AESSP_02634 [Aestuariimicrobium sp. T2.26MG-19.2B]
MRIRRVALALTSVAAIGLAPTAIVHALAWGHQAGSTNAAPHRDVLLVLGAGVLPDGQPGAYLKARLDLAADLYASGKASVILVSGDNREANYNEPLAMQRYLVRHGVPAGRIVRDPAGFDTYDSCVRAKRIYGVSRLTLVTQGYHLPRAVATCRMVGVDTFGVGDHSAKAASPGQWRYGVVRELPAAWKTMYDVVSRRTPTLGQPDPSVQQALGS